jgi:hypothetical protein
MTTGRARGLDYGLDVRRSRRPLRRNASGGRAVANRRRLCPHARRCSTTACSVAYTSSSRDSEVVIESGLPVGRRLLSPRHRSPFWFERFTTVRATARTRCVARSCVFSPNVLYRYANYGRPKGGPDLMTVRFGTRSTRPASYDSLASQAKT